jgi:NTE family protein
MDRALVLSGGAAKGAYQVGALKHLMGDLKIQYDAVCGISVGAINGGWIAMFPHGQEVECIDGLEEMWRGLTTSDIYVNWLNWPKPFSYLGYIKALWKPSIYNSQPLMNLIRTKYDSERMRASGKSLRVGAVNLNTGAFRVFDESFEDMTEAILASSSFPGAFLPIKIDGQLWTDGGVKEVTPLKSAISLGAKAIDVIITSPEKDLSDFTENPNMIKLGPRIVDIMSEEIMLNDLDRMLEINKLIKNGAKIPNKRYIDIRIIRPNETLVESSLSFEQEFIGPMIDKGYEDARKITGM